MTYSRSFNLEIAGVNTTCLMPLADVLHRTCPPKHTEWYYDNRIEGLEIKACEDIPKNTVVSIGFGEAMSNTTLFLAHGFI